MKKLLAFILALAILTLAGCSKTADMLSDNQSDLSSQINVITSDIVSSIESEDISSGEVSSDDTSSQINSSISSTQSNSKNNSTTSSNAPQSSSNTTSSAPTDEPSNLPTIELYTITEHHGAKGFFHQIEENIDNSFELELVKTLGLATDTSNVHGYETEYFNTDTGDRIRFITVGKNDNFKKEVDVIGGTSLHANIKDPKGILEKNRLKPENQTQEPKYGSVSFWTNGGNSDYWIWSNMYYVWEEGEFDDSFDGGHWKWISGWTRGTTLEYDETAFYNFLGGMTTEPKRSGRYEGECVNYFAAVYMDTKAGTYIDTNHPSNGTITTEDPRYTYKGGGWGWVEHNIIWKWEVDNTLGEMWNQRRFVVSTAHSIGDWAESRIFAEPYLTMPERKGTYEGEEVHKKVYVWYVK